MEMRTIGSLEVSVVGLGTNNFGFGMPEDEVLPVVDAAIESGINFFDTAKGYRDSEKRLGRALGKRRNDVVIATKFGSASDEDCDGAPKNVRKAIEQSLKHLATDRIDLYQLHYPDAKTPIAETLGVLDELVHEGKVLEIGCSNFSAAELRAAADAAEPGAARFVSVQNHYNLLNRADEAEVLPECEALDLAYLPYFPLASGMLTGKYLRGEAPAPETRLVKWKMAERMLTERNFEIVDALSSWAADDGHSLLDLAFAWLASHPVVSSVIAGATRPEQVRANAAAGSWQLSPEQVLEVNALAALQA
jgi:aryl-alcohol dehydrogenase-like predicted oxidoreductase